MGLLVQKGQVVNDPLLFLQPFDVKLWVALLGAVFAAAVIQKLISLYTPYGDRRAVSACSYADAPEQLCLSWQALWQCWN